ncbi:MAG: molybdate ABC transporter permease subunit [Actinobacteria bacterium]|nr:molybdate ABC transporter permease subunit [Actinomycetota bacterium]MCB9390831.1 molybdate ABC transporter permease subunit [Acidimicrobiia bacterium]
MAVSLFVLPLIALASNAPWSSLGQIYTSPVALDALRISAIASITATLICVVLGVPLAFVLARTDFPGRRIVRALVVLPMVLPPVVGGTALLLAFGRRGMVGGPLYDATGLLLPYSMWGVVLANVFVAMPFLVVTVYGALRALDRRPEAAAATLGASEAYILRRITLPAIAPSVGAGVVLCWARALGEFGATVTFAGNLEGRTQTLPLAVFVTLGSDRDGAVAISLMLVAVSVTVLIALRERWWGQL